MHLVFMGISATSTFHCLSAWLVYNILGVMNSYIARHIHVYMLFIVYVMMDLPYVVWVRQPTIGLKYIALFRNPDLPSRRKGECSSHYGLAVAAKAKPLCFMGSVSEVWWVKGKCLWWGSQHKCQINQSDHSAGIPNTLSPDLSFLFGGKGWG